MDIKRRTFGWLHPYCKNLSGFGDLLTKDFAELGSLFTVDRGAIYTQIYGLSLNRTIREPYRNGPPDLGSGVLAAFLAGKHF
jgi:hypothetical protein